jgi:hypothetical protein
MKQVDKPLENIVLSPGAEAGWPRSAPVQDETRSLVKLLASSIAILKARRGLFFAVAILVFIGAVIATYAQSPKYESSAKLMVQLDMQTVALSQADVRYNIAMKMADEAVGTQVELLRSNALIERVIDQLGENVLAGKPRTGIMAFVMGIVDGAKKAGSDALIALGLVDQTSPRQALAQNHQQQPQGAPGAQIPDDRHQPAAQEPRSDAAHPVGADRTAPEETG